MTAAFIPASRFVDKVRKKVALLKWTFLSTVVLTAFAGVLYSQNVAVGLGSYTTSLPSGAVGVQLGSGADARPKIADEFDQAIQTNDFWSSLIYPFSGLPHSNNLFAHPLNFRAESQGLKMGYSTDPVYAASDYLFPFHSQLTVGVEGMNAAETRTLHYGDWTVTALWEDGTRRMRATIGHGLPFAYFHIEGADAVLHIEGTPTVWYDQEAVLGFSVNGRHYGAFAPTGSSWSGSSELRTDLNGGNYLAVALLPDALVETLQLFKTHAYAEVVDSRVEWDYDELNAELSTIYRYETVLRDSAEGHLNETLTALYRHQWLNTDDVMTDFSYRSPRGEMKLREGNEFTTKMRFNGILPGLPDAGNYNRDVLLAYVQEAAAEGLPVGPTYENGKLMARFANLVHIADQLGAVDERDHFLAEMKKRLEEWLTAGGEQQYYYDAAWNVLTGYPSGYGADTQINDHHFHSSYAIITAATIAHYDSAWAAPDNWGGMIDLLIRDSNNWDRSDSRFPFLRTHDIYAGHSWAAGHGDFGDGNNQESSSESINFASACILWGEETGQKEIRDLGIFLHSTESSAVDQYWFDVEDEVFPAEYGHAAIGMVWGGKGVHSTWFGADPEFIHGINFLPITSGSLYLGRHPEYIIRNYEEIVKERNGQPTKWKDIMWQYLAMSDADLALSYYYADQDYEVFDGESRAHSYHWLHNFKKLGHVNTEIYADIPLYAVFEDGNGDLTYTAYNAGSQARMVNFSDGHSMMLPAGEMVTYSTRNDDPRAPVAMIMADRIRGKVPLTVHLSAERSFDPNNDSLSYAWDLGDGTFFGDIDTIYTFSEVGIYTVRLRVTNTLPLSAEDSVLITVLGNGTPYTGTPIAVPGIVEAEYYDLGGEGVAYHDVDAVNWGVPFRSDEGVDLEGASDGGYDIGWIKDGEWVEYTLDVKDEGLYTVSPLISSVPGGGQLHIEFNGQNLSGKVDVPVTGGWQFWREIPVYDIPLKAGEQIMHLQFYNGEFNLNRIIIEAQPQTDIDAGALAEKFKLHPNHPNPFNPTTSVKFELPGTQFVTVKVYNTRGQEVRTLLQQQRRAGLHEILFDASGLASGMYLYSVETDEFHAVGKMILMK